MEKRTVEAFPEFPKPETLLSLHKKIWVLEQRIKDLETNQCYKCLCEECTNRTVE